MTSDASPKRAHPSPDAPSDQWPRWQLTLPNASPSRPEGGLRIRGILTPRPLISYLTVTRNAGRTLERTIRSVLVQRSPLVEHVVIDGKSTDNTLDIIRRHEDALDYYVSEPDGGLYEAINKGIGVCRGAYICVLNADDWLTPRAVQTVMRHLSENSDGRVVHAFGAWKVEAGKKNKLWPPRPVSIGDYLRCADLCHNALYVPRHVYEMTGPYDVGFGIAADFKWMMAALDAGASYETHRRPTVFYSLGGISSNSVGHAREAIRVLHSRFPDLSSEQAEALYTRFHTFRDNVREYGAVATDTVEQVLTRIMRPGSRLVELKAAIDDATASERAQARRAQAARGPLRRINDALEKLIWRIIDQHNPSNQ